MLVSLEVPLILTVNAHESPAPFEAAGLLFILQNFSFIMQVFYSLH
ncbi:protein of unknown function [Paenibacillus alvei]|uniref:Uncharacterized protein n=1 Tax=Paenibacillus alvei TaxID=44250 RepID=A0A383RKB4_PAEAL|nr:protein of unknown function [Paenibacillus alvei]